MEYKHGHPVEVSNWIKKRGFNVDFDENTDYAMASYLEILTKWLHEPTEDFFRKNSLTFKRAVHSKAFETDAHINLFELALAGEKVKIDDGLPSDLDYFKKHDQLRLFISTEPMDKEVFNRKIRSTRKMELHLPYAEASHEEEIDELIGMRAVVDGREATADKVCLNTKFTSDNKGAEAKQMASMGLVFASCCIKPKKIWLHRIEVLDTEYDCYIKLDDELVFGVNVEETDFTEGSGTPSTAVRRDGMMVKAI